MDHTTIMKEKPLTPRTVDSPQEVRMFKGPCAALIPFVLAGALLLPSTALAGERAPAPAPVAATKAQATGKKDTKRPQAYYKKIQHQWELELKALGGNAEKAKMHHRKYHTLIKRYRQRVAQAEQAAGPDVALCEVVLCDPSTIE